MTKQKIDINYKINLTLSKIVTSLITKELKNQKIKNKKYQRIIENINSKLKNNNSKHAKTKIMQTSDEEEYNDTAGTRSNKETNKTANKKQKTDTNESRPTRPITQRNKNNHELNDNKEIKSDKNEQLNKPHTHSVNLKNTNNLTRKEINTKKKETINSILLNNKITNINDLDNLDISIIEEITKQNTSGRQNAIYKKAQELLNNSKSNINTNTSSSTQIINTDYSRKNVNKRKRSIEEETKETVNLNKQNSSENNEMPNEQLVVYSHIFTGPNLIKFHSDEQAKQRLIFTQELSKFNLNKPRNIFLAKQPDNNEWYLKITTTSEEDDKILKKKTNQHFGGLTLCKSEIETNWRMTCYGFNSKKDGYDERTQSEQSYLNSNGIIKAERKDKDDGTRAASMRLELKDANSFFELYTKKLLLGNSICNCEPVWRHPKFCKNCGQFEHYEDECEAETLCYKCGDADHLNSNCPNVPFCYHCNEEGEDDNEHLTIQENTCKFYIKEFKRLNKVYVDLIETKGKTLDKNFIFQIPENRILRGLVRKNKPQSIMNENIIKQAESNTQKVAIMEEKIVNLENEMREIKTFKVETEKKISKLEELFDKTESKLSNMDSKLSNTESKLSTMDSKLSNMDSNFNTGMVSITKFMLDIKNRLEQDDESISSNKKRSRSKEDGKLLTPSQFSSSNILSNQMDHNQTNNRKDPDIENLFKPSTMMNINNNQ